MFSTILLSVVKSLTSFQLTLRQLFLRATKFSVTTIFIPFIAFHSLQEKPDHLVITEVYYSALGVDADREWVEIANMGNGSVQLSEIKVGDEESIWGGEGMFRFPDGATINPGQVIVVAQKAVGFRELYGRDPDYEIVESIEQVPNMDQYRLWSSGELALANDGDEVLLLDSNNLLIDAISYGDNQTIFNPSIAGVFEGQSIERIPASCDTDTAADWQPQRIPTPGIINMEGECANSLAINADETGLLAIGQIQGDGDVSPYINQTVTFRGVVTGYHEDRNADGIIFYSLFAQSVPGEEDGDLATSDGISIFLGLEKPTYTIGDVIHVKGNVTEFFGLTEIDDDGLEISGETDRGSLPEPIKLAPPGQDEEKLEYYETLEGMLVALTFDALVAGPTHSGCGFDVYETLGERVVLPIRYIGEKQGPILSILHHSDVDCSDLPQVKTGDRVVGLLGPLTYHFERFKIVQQEMNVLQVEKSDLTIAKPAPILQANQISIATYNLDNFFDEKRDSSNDAEPIINRAEQELKRKKITYVIAEILLCPTLVAVQEVENETLLGYLVEDLQDRCGISYQINHQDGPDSRGLDVALLSDPGKVQLLEEEVHQTCTEIETGIADIANECSEDQSPLFGRPPLDVDVKISGEKYKIIIVHLKSKRGEETETEQRRIAQARYLNQVISTNDKLDPNLSIIILGDFNDYEQSTTMQMIARGELLQNALMTIDLEDRYSYIFDGRTQLIDGILVSKNIEEQVAHANIFHLNANFPVGLANDMSDIGLPYRSSDHDIPFIVLNTGEQEKQIEELQLIPSPELYSTPSELKGAAEEKQPVEKSVDQTNLGTKNRPVAGNNRGLIYGGGVLVVLLACLLFYVLIRRT